MKEDVSEYFHTRLGMTTMVKVVPGGRTVLSSGVPELFHRAFALTV